MNIVKVDNDFGVSSDPALGATNVSADGSRFTVNFDQPLTIPRDAIFPVLSIERATIWYTFVNISASIGNNKVYVTEGATPYTLTIPDGLYTLAEIEETIIDLGQNAGITNSPDTFIELDGNSATQKVELTINYANISVEFKADSPLEILGTTATTYGTGTAGTVYFFPNVAGFNSINNVQAHTSLLRDGIPVNNKFSQIAGIIQIDTQAGNQLRYAPQRPQMSTAEHLKGAQVTSADFYITNENGTPIDTNDEFFTFEIRISYYLKI